MNSESYKAEAFLVTDPDARVRKDGELDEYVTGPDGRVRADPERHQDQRRRGRGRPGRGRRRSTSTSMPCRPTGRRRSAGPRPPISRAAAVGAVGAYPAAAGDGPIRARTRRGRPAPIRPGHLVKVVGTDEEIEHISEATCDKFLAMADGRARRRGHDRGQQRLPLLSRAEIPLGRPPEGPARLRAGQPAGHVPTTRTESPSTSTSTAAAAIPIYVWLSKNATRFGFLRTVSSEPWHWEYLPDKAASARARGVFTTWE